MRLIFLLFIIIIYSDLPALASPELENTTPLIHEKTDFSALSQPETVKVRQVIDPLTFTITKDKRIFRLVGLDLPGQTSFDPTDNAKQAKVSLTKLIEGKEIHLYQTKKRDKGRINAMGHNLVHAETIKDATWVQGALLENGFARVRTTFSNPEMAAQMYKAEDKARTGKKGLWDKDRYTVLTPQTAQDAAKAFQIVQGKILNTAIKKNRFYLNFGPDWRTDFTISIAPEKRKDFARQSYKPLEWNGQTVRVRGWLDSYNGPYIEIDHPEAIEFLGNTK
jgi:micrococcal nuclease